MGSCTCDPIPTPAVWFNCSMVRIQTQHHHLLFFRLEQVTYSDRASVSSSMDQDSSGLLRVRRSKKTKDVKCLE